MLNLLTEWGGHRSTGTRLGFYFMKSLKKALSEYHLMLTIPKTNPRIVWVNNQYMVTMYYSESTLKRLGWEVII